MDSLFLLFMFFFTFPPFFALFFSASGLLLQLAGFVSLCKSYDNCRVLLEISTLVFHCNEHYNWEIHSVPRWRRCTCTGFDSAKKTTTLLCTCMLNESFCCTCQIGKIANYVFVYIVTRAWGCIGCQIMNGLA